MPDPELLANRIARFAAMTSIPDGVTRLGYTALERDAHTVFADELRALDLRVWTDPAGNTIAESPGSGPGIGTGSHLDSVPNGGRFDGIAGVVAAMEAARLLVEHRIEHVAPFRFVAFACEEGARFGQACIGSRFAAGLMDDWRLASLADRTGVRLVDAMQQLEFDASKAASQPWHRNDWGAFIELHVEQGGVLEETGVGIGIVDLISGSSRLRFELTGIASHTGATPMKKRHDALAAAAELVLIAEEIALDSRHRGTRATVGTLEVSPGSITTIPGRVSLSLDVRDVDSDRQRDTAMEIVRRTVAACQRRGVEVEVSLIGDTSPVVLSIWLRDVVARACRNSGSGYRVMTSGASHDAQNMNHITPTAMLFVPSRSGLSHVPEEWTSSHELAQGTAVLLSAMLHADAELQRVNGGAA
jgi:allantoate deiminase